MATGWNGVDTPSAAWAAVSPVDIPLPANLAHRVASRPPLRHEVLRSQLALVEESGLRCVVVGGEAGMGKTTLLAEFAHAVTSSATATVLYGRCNQTGAPLNPSVRCSTRVLSMHTSTSWPNMWPSLVAS